MLAFNTQIRRHTKEKDTCILSTLLLSLPLGEANSVPAVLNSRDRLGDAAALLSPDHLHVLGWAGLCFCQMGPMVDSVILETF